MATALVLTVIPVLASSRPTLEWRTIDGSDNNLDNPDWGAVGSQLLRITKVYYADRVSEPAGGDRPSARHVSNVVCAQGDQVIFNPASASDFLWQWGQFIDHDTTLVDLAIPLEPFDIPVPAGDPFFDPDGTGEVVIHLERSAYDPESGTDSSNPRQQIEFITSFVDGSQVYGSDETRALALRDLDGTGRLKTSAGDLLPFNVDGLPNFGGPDPSLFLAGDIRANEQIGLTSMHTLWVREHNRHADLIREMHPEFSGEEVYQSARAMVGAEIQVITYKEFLPILIGPDAIPPYERYDDRLDPGIANVFAAAAYRVGHTLLSPMLRRLDAGGETMGDVPLGEAFFAIDIIIDEGGIDPILRGLASQAAQNVDPFVVDGVRNFLFGQPGEGGFDLASLNMQRGRDHGIPSYTEARLDLGLSPVDRFDEISSDPGIQRALEDAYGDVRKIDLWVGGIAEDHVPGALVGELLQTIIADQFRRLRDGDRFWYENVFSGATLEFLESVTLADVIRWNTAIDAEISDDVFRVPGSLCEGDITGDGVVDVLDLIEVIVGWAESDHPADVDGDGTVGVLDLIIVINGFGSCAP